MKIIIPGGSGQVGTLLARTFCAAGHEVVVLSRAAQPSVKTPENPWEVLPWDAKTLGDWTTQLENADVVINLAGRSVNCRYHARNRREIMQSRIDSTKTVGQAIAQSRRPPRVWLQASTATIYAHTYERPNDEATGVLGGSEPSAPDTWRFSIEVAKAWEQAAQEIAIPETRRVLMRTAMVMSPDRGGVFDTLLGLVRRGLGGATGDGRQYMSWIHEHDFIHAVQWLIDHDNLSGVVNLASPQPLPNAEFMRALRQAWGTSIGLPATRWMLEVAAVFLQTESELILKSRRVVPGRLLSSGFEFQFPSWSSAAAELCQRWRAIHNRSDTPSRALRDVQPKQA